MSFRSVKRSLPVNNTGGQGGGQGGGAGEQLAEMFELEMDLDRNQYETGSRATLEEQAEQVDENLRALEDLARRQEQLANSMRNREQFTEAERYQQEVLRREAEQLERQINQQQAQNGGHSRTQSHSKMPNLNQLVLRKNLKN